MTARLIITLSLILFGAACSAEPTEVAFQATEPLVTVTAPVYTVTPTRTPTFTYTPPPTATLTPSATNTPLPTFTVTPPDTDTPAPAATQLSSEAASASAASALAASASAAALSVMLAAETASATFSTRSSGAPTSTETPNGVAGTSALVTLTPPLPFGAPAAFEAGSAAVSESVGWSCGDFPCEDDLEGWLRRIRAPQGFVVEPAGRFPGQVQQIAYGRDGALYATVLEEGTRNGAVYRLDAAGTLQRYSGSFFSPLGLAFQPETDLLYVSARAAPEQSGGIWRIPAGGGEGEPVVVDLPCCFTLIDNQPNGMIFGRDGALYVGVGAVSDTSENPPRSNPAYRALDPHEASVLRVHPFTGEIAVYAAGIRSPFDLALDSIGQLYATDNGILAGPGDRLLRLEAGGHYGFPYWRERGCETCEIKPASVSVLPDLLRFSDFTLPRGVVVYTGTQFPLNYFDNLFVALWNNVEGGQRIVRVDPRRLSEADYAPEAFLTGLIRPVDVVVAPDGSLAVADYVYGLVWRVRYAP
ncbi:MAG: PQQ-dependent sugar dehydrogenase [Anaerolineae bacterium]|nr:PQQ-dependent sugar dehydrogenase [Anaerolineae bacterium]NUQ02966.1 PQQ-dependent sugar dehydrogenase [Anaerolineae bacterium]